MINNVERIIVGKHHWLKPWSSVYVFTASRNSYSNISNSLVVRIGKELLPRNRYYSSSSTSHVGDNRLVGGTLIVDDKQKKKKPVLEQYDIFSHDDPSAKKKTSVQGYGETCFDVNNVHVRQSIVLLPTKFLLWDAKTVADITVESLSVFPLLSPSVEILLVGYGEHQPSPFPRELISHFRTLGIFVETMSSVHAISTFNVLNAEDRNVAAAILTIHPWSPTNDLDVY